MRAIVVAFGLALACSPCLAAYNAPAALGVLRGSSTAIGGAALVAGACTSGTVAIAGATTAMVVDVTPAAYPGAAIRWAGYVSASGIVTVVVCADVAATPTATTYNVRVIP